jgi:hypothetical protein
MTSTILTSGNKRRFELFDSRRLIRETKRTLNFIVIDIIVATTCIASVVASRHSCRNRHLIAIDWHLLQRCANAEYRFANWRHWQEACNRCAIDLTTIYRFSFVGLVETTLHAILLLTIIKFKSNICFQIQYQRNISSSRRTTTHCLFCFYT